jgi:SAM dependent carboxyl methyltransferase
MVDRRVDESVMAGHGEYSEHSRPQHAAASVAYPYLRRAAEEVPLPDETAPLQILDMGCAGGRNEMEPVALAIDGLRGRGAGNAVEIVHTDLPENDFGPLFELLDGPDAYTAGRDRLFPSVVGRTHFGPLVADARAHLAWTGITLHWLSTMPCVVPDAVFANLTTGDAREALKHQAARDWEVFLRERARELVDEGQLVIVAGASDDEGRSGAEGLFGMIGDQLRAMVTDGTLRRAEDERIFYPTWNRTLEEWLAPLRSGDLGASFEVLAHRQDATDDRTTYPQYARDGDAAAFAAAYVGFVRPVTENSLFRSLDEDRSDAEREAIKTAFYRGLQQRIEAAPDVAVCDWRVVSLRLRRRPRTRG